MFIISSMYGSFQVSNITPEEVLSISEELLYSTFIENPFNDFYFPYFWIFNILADINKEHISYGYCFIRKLNYYRDSRGYYNN